MNNRINIEVPLLDTYVGVVRLVAVAAACKAELNIDKTEDVKVVVTEIINELLIEKKCEKVTVTFLIEKGNLNIEFCNASCPDITDVNIENMGACIIRALSDELKYDNERKTISLCIKAGKVI